MTKRNLLSSAALAVLLAAPLPPADAQTAADQPAATTEQDGKSIRRVGTDAWPVAKDDAKKDEAKKPASTSTVTSDPLSIKSSAEAKDDKAEKAKEASAQDATKDGSASAKIAAEPAATGQTQAVQPAVNAPAPQTAQPAAPATAATASNASVRLGTDAEGRVAANASQSRQMVTALHKAGARPIEGVDITIKAGVVVPTALRLTTASSEMIEVFPQFRGYSYFTTREQLVIVEPATRKIVGLVPLKDTATAARPPADKARISSEGRATPRHATRERSVTTGTAVRDGGRDDLPPPGMLLRETTVTTAAGTRTYRRMERAGDTVVIRRAIPQRMIEVESE